MAQKWCTEIRCGYSSTSNSECSGRVTMAKNEKTHDMVLSDGISKECDNMEAIDILHSPVVLILKDHLGKRILIARGVLRLLTSELKRNIVTTSKESFTFFTENLDEILHHLIFVDETLRHLNTPETKEQLKHWIFCGRISGEEVQAGSVSQQNQGDLFLRYTRYNPHRLSPNEKTSNSTYYANLLNRLKQFIETKRPHFAKNEVLFHHSQLLRWIIYHIPQIYTPVTITCSQTWRNGSAERDSSPKMKSSLKQSFILSTSTNHISWKR